MNVNLEDFTRYLEYSSLKNNIKNVEESDKKEYTLSKEEYLRLLKKEKDAFDFFGAIRIRNNQNRKRIDEIESQQITMEELESLYNN